MTTRIEQMTVQQLLDAGFSVDISKFNCGHRPTLDAKQWGAPTAEEHYNGATWTRLIVGDIKLAVTFYK